MSTAQSLIQPIVNADRVQLVIPPTTERGVDWQPHRFTPSIVLARVDPIPQWLKGDKQLNEAYSAPELSELPSMTTVVLADRIGKSPDFGDMYYANLRDATGHETGGLVVNVLDMLSFLPVEKQEQVRFFLGKEIEAYTLMAKVQGKAVPRFGGLFGRGSLFCLFFEDAGGLVTEEARENIRQTLRDINASGVAIYPNHWQFIRQHPDSDGSINMTPFGRSTFTMRNLTADRVERANRDAQRRKPSFPGRTREEWFEFECARGHDMVEDLLEYYERPLPRDPFLDSP